MTAGGQIDRLKRAEIHQGHLFVRTAVPLGACQAQCTVEEKLRARIPYQAIPLNVKVCLDVERLYLVWIVRVGCKNHHAILLAAKRHHYS